MNLTVKQVAWHRNGICGEGFYAVLFTDAEEGPMVAALFDEPGYCAVFHIPRLANGNVAFGDNSWRGDRYASELRPLVEEWMKANGTNRCGPFSAITPENVAKVITEQEARKARRKEGNR